MEWVRVELAEHNSTVYDTIPKGAIPIIIQLVLAGMAAAEEEAHAEDDDDDAQETGEKAS